MIIDLHVHTSEGSNCSSITIQETIALLKCKGFDGMLITDHESDSGYRSYLENMVKDNFVVLKGYEISTLLGDMLVILPNECSIISNEKIAMQCIDPIELCDIVHNLGGVVGIAHMFRDSYSSIGNRIKTTENLEKILESVDFIEVENGMTTRACNQMALEVAEKYIKVKTKGSDSHESKEVGRCGTVFMTSIHSEVDLINAIKNNSISQ